MLLKVTEQDRQLRKLVRLTGPMCGGYVNTLFIIIPYYYIIIIPYYYYKYYFYNNKNRTDWKYERSTMS